MGTDFPAKKSIIILSSSIRDLGFDGNSAARSRRMHGFRERRMFFVYGTMWLMTASALGRSRFAGVLGCRAGGMFGAFDGGPFFIVVPGFDQ